LAKDSEVNRNIEKVRSQGDHATATAATPTAMRRVNRLPSVNASSIGTRLSHAE
jgi:hypothetical protein